MKTKIYCCDKFTDNTRVDGFVIVDGEMCVGGCCCECCVLVELKHCPYCGAEIEIVEKK
jgi:hypothetical protein